MTQFSFELIEREEFSYSVIFHTARESFFLSSSQGSLSYVAQLK